MKEQITIFHLYRKDGVPLFLHPFSDPLRLLQLGKDTEIVGRYGREPRPESITLLRNELYRSVDIAVKSWITEKRFIPSFLLSSGLFLVIYLFMSLVIRDPIPMIDELAIALGGAIVLYFFLSRKAASSREASEQRIMLREKIDSIYFDHLPFLDKAEELLDVLEHAPDALVRSLEMERDGESLEKEGKALQTDEKSNESKEIEELLSHLEKRFSSRAYKGIEKKRKKMMKSGDRVAIKGGGPVQVGETQQKKIDLPLFSLYHLLRGKAGKKAL
jgi:hypothetical protein